MLRGITTQGDRIVDRPLAEVGGKGLFIKEIETAMTDDRADLAVHSLKDMPMVDGRRLRGRGDSGARGSARRARVDQVHDLDEPPGRRAIVGTSSPRREAQLRARNPRSRSRMLRGNVNTRVRRLDEGNYDAIVLATAGLNRLGLGHRITATLDPEEFLPAVGQGALALECRADRSDVIAAIEPLIDRSTLLAVTAERAFARALSGSCHTPLAGYAIFRDGELWLRGLLASGDGSEILRGETSGGGRRHRRAPRRSVQRSRATS